MADKPRIRRDAGLKVGLSMFLKQMDAVKKDQKKDEIRKKNFIEKYEPESCTQNSDSSKETSKDITVDRNSLTPSQEKALPLNDKPVLDHTKQNSYCRPSVDQNQDASDIQESRHSRHYNSFNNSSDYKINAGHDYFETSKFNRQKFSDCHKEKFLQSNYKTSTDLVKSSNSKQITAQNSNAQMQVFKNHNRSNISDNYHSRSNVSDNYHSRLNASDNYNSKSNVSDNYHSKSNVSDNYHNKSNVSDNYHSRSNVSDNYHSKSNVSDNYHSKSNVSDNYHSKPNVSDKYHMNTGHRNISKPNYEKSNSLSNSSNMKAFEHKSNFKHSDSSTVSPKNFNNNKFFDQEFSYNSKKYNQHDSHRNNFSRNNHNYTSDQCFKFQDKLETKDSMLTQNIKEQNNMEENSYISDGWDFENVITVDTDVKYQRKFSESNETLKNSEDKNIKITCNFLGDLESDSLLTSPVSNEPVSPILNQSLVSVSSSVSSISNASPISILENSSYYAMFDYPTNDTIKELISSDDSIIPPPVACDSTNASENLCSNVEKSLTSLQKNISEDSYADEEYFSLPDSEHLDAISNFITKIVEERSAPGSVADKVVRDLNIFFKKNFEGNVIDYYGSYYCGLAITTSDINLVVQADVSMRKSFMTEIHNFLSKELERYHVYSFEEGENVYKSKINFTHPDTGINCELAYLGTRKKSFWEMGKFLKEMCSKDKRTTQLIIATKVWAEHFNINEVEDGKLHPVGFALLVVHYLQHCEKPLLPIYSTEEKEMDKLSYNDVDIGTLWLGFLRYYAFKYNWQDDIVTVTSMDRISKKSKKWEHFWIAIEDPFSGNNIALSVKHKDVADYIKCCFKKTYDYFLNGPENIPSLGDEEKESGNESDNSQLKFSFNDCIVEQNEGTCEMCDEIDDICDECQKKIYVQPDIACVPKMTDEFLKLVKKALDEVYGKYILSQEEISERKEFVKKLESDVRKIYPDAQMHLFGSSANGFGFKKSDLDICMTFKSKKEFKAITVLKDLRNLLRRDKNRNFVNVIAIFHAQIPILKFRYEPKGWRGDISLDNVLAVHNSELLYTYSLIDERCKVLGCALKLIAKKALIAEVTEKALSSYSYLIMVIHFLQQINPPVLPILQDNQFRKDTFELDDIIDSCNVWFCRDIKHIERIFKTENNAPVEQLFLDLLDYYCYFDCNQVITIRQKEELTLCKDMRLARLFQIQDPFIVTRNLGCVVSPNKARETKSVFNRARMLFRSPIKEISINDLESYFFSTMSLTGRIQTEAFCDFCGKFGHDQNGCKQSSPQKKFSFKYGPRKYQYAYQNGIFKEKQMNRRYFKGKF